MKKSRTSQELQTPELPRQLQHTEAPAWTFLTNHMHVLLCLYRDPAATLREVAAPGGHHRTHGSENRR
ncbi:MAG UNVERIFIED_CONTAM: hypothetical protein LVR18_39570 [Planctomycetaceae bacterium]